jgi:Holliday junction resolvasome RuvABC DNA-binding subunit
VVDHLTTVTTALRGGRAEDLARALAGLGFTVRRERDRVAGDSAEVEAHEAKRALRALGFEDREYQVTLEYVRQWGIL